MTETTDSPAPRALSFNEQDPMLLEVQKTGRLPQTWWANPTLTLALGKLCQSMAASSMVPADFRNKPENVQIALAAGLPLGLSPLACVQSVAVINGRPTLWGDAVMAQVLAHPSLVSLSEEITGTIKDEDYRVAITITRKLPSGVEQTITREFSVEDAKKASLWKKAGPWSNYPARMVYNRARAFALRDLFADVLGGISLAADNEEVIHEVVATVRDAPPETTVDESPGLAPSSEPAPPAPPKKPRKARHYKTKPRAMKEGDTFGEPPKVYLRDSWLELDDLTVQDLANLPAIVIYPEGSPVQNRIDHFISDDEQPNRVADEQAQAEAAAALNNSNERSQGEDPDEVEDKKLVGSGGATVLRGWCKTLDELEEGGVHFDTTDGTVSICNGDGWREVKPDEATLHANVMDHLAEHMAKALTKWCQTQRMDREDAMDWAKDKLALKKSPAKFLALTTSQLAELVFESEG